MIKLQRKFAILTVPAVLALGALSYGAVVAAAAREPSGYVGNRAGGDC
jgi:hypothetical protein